ncbi:MAG TPA: hypothetical protein VK458_14435 [Myxococcaceae bacterium]|nr:hypothetical protein [Myxococcaceae bacterium]
MRALAGLWYGSRVQVIRFRRLTSHFDGESHAAIERALHPPAFVRVESLPDDTPGGAPRLVSAQEGSGTVEQVRVLLLSGDLRLTDLVDVGDGWQTFDDCLLFDAEREQLLRRARPRRWALGVLVGLGGALGVLVLAALLWWDFLPSLD